jgi:hypothetical protein
MDHHILASAGGYQDRNEFVSEAIRDRLAEDAAMQPEKALDQPSYRQVAQEIVASAVPQPARDSAMATGIPATARAPGGQVYLGDWHRGETCTVPARPTDLVNFGLHNRDFPTLWALNRLATMTSRDPVTWDQFVAFTREESAGVGERLRLSDLSQATPIPIGIGFPKPGPKREQSLDRFVAAMIGSKRRTDGPIFALALAGFADDDRQTVAPTNAGLAALGDMVDRGLGTVLPQPQPVFERWWQYLSEWAPAERAAWHKVLTVVAENPDRDGLVSRFPEWRGHIATTNTVGFISRSREWGLVPPQMFEGRYQLTDLGAAVAQER